MTLRGTVFAQQAYRKRIRISVNIEYRFIIEFHAYYMTTAPLIYKPAVNINATETEKGGLFSPLQ